MNLLCYIINKTFIMTQSSQKELRIPTFFKWTHVASIWIQTLFKSSYKLVLLIFFYFYSHFTLNKKVLKKWK